MSRAIVLALLALVSPQAGPGQGLSVLHIRVVLTDAERNPTPVPRHVLLVSDNPSSAAPRRVMTGADGTVDVGLRPGNYTVESDRPIAFNGIAYTWTRNVDVTAGREAVLELTAANAEAEPVTSSAAGSAAPLEADPSFLLPRWADSVVALWTPRSHASGFMIDANGLIATNQRVVGTATSVEVQVSSAVKVMARVLAADPLRNVAILWIDPQAAPALKPLPLGCGQAARPAVADREELFTIGAPLREQKGMASGTVSRVEPHTIDADFRLPSGSEGGPVFTAGGGLVGITSVVDDGDAGRRGDARVVRIEEACDVLVSAEKKLKDAAPPSAIHLPIEPGRPFPIEALKEAAQHRAGSLSPYAMSSSDFDVAFITPVLTYGAEYQAQQASERERTKGTRTPQEPPAASPLRDFSNWSEYVGTFPPVLLVRVTPKFVEGFWTTVARGAARTQGVALPPIKRYKSGFSRMRVFCGDAEVTPIHPFKLEQRVSDTDAINEGLYVFDPGALGPQCGTVKLTLYSEKEPDKGDPRVVDPKVLEQIWQDFMPYRQAAAAPAR